MKTRFSQIIIVGIIFALTYNFLSSLTLELSGKKAEGTIVDTFLVSGSRSTLYEGVEAEYKTVDGQLIRSRTDNAFNRGQQFRQGGYKVSDSVILMYDPANPTDFIIVENTAIIWLLNAAEILFFGWVLLYSSRKSVSPPK